MMNPMTKISHAKTDQGMPPHQRVNGPARLNAAQDPNRRKVGPELEHHIAKDHERLNCG